MRCAFVFAAYDRPCGRWPDVGYRVELPTGDSVEVLFCESHAMAYRAIMDAERERKRVVPEPPGAEPEL